MHGPERGRCRDKRCPHNCSHITKSEAGQSVTGPEAEQCIVCGLMLEAIKETS